MSGLACVAKAPFLTSPFTLTNSLDPVRMLCLDTSPTDLATPSGRAPRLKHLSTRQSFTFGDHWDPFGRLAKSLVKSRIQLSTLDVVLQTSRCSRLLTNSRLTDFPTTIIAPIAQMESVQKISIYWRNLPHVYCYLPSDIIEDGDHSWKRKITLRRCSGAEEGCPLLHGRRSETPEEAWEVQSK